MRRTWDSVGSHRATIGYLVLSVAVLLALLGVQAKGVESCRDRKHQWDALHSVIVTSYAPQKPSAALLAAFPQLKPFYTPGNPAYEQQKRAADDRLNAVLDKLGDRPSC